MNNFQEGLRILYDMELNDYLMLKSIDELNKEINLLYPLKESPPPKQDIADLDFDDAIIPVIICAIIGLIVGIIIAINAGNSFLYTLLDMVVSSIFGVIIGAICGCVVGFIVMIICRNHREKKLKIKYKKALIAYDVDKAHTEKMNEKRKAKQKILIAQRNSLVKRQEESVNRLIDFYDIMGIDENYRNIIPIGYMYELARLGISNKLAGTDGLYYLVRKELRNDKFQYSLNEISNKLDTIISNQHDMYHQITSIDKKCNNLIKNAVSSAELSAKNNQLLSEAVRNTSLVAYNSERIKQEIQFQNFMKYY